MFNTSGTGIFSLNKAKVVCDPVSLATQKEETKQLDIKVVKKTKQKIIRLLLVNLGIAPFSINQFIVNLIFSTRQT